MIDMPESTLLESIPHPLRIQERLGRIEREGALLRRLLRVAQQAEEERQRREQERQAG